MSISVAAHLEASAADLIADRFASLSPAHQRLAEFILAEPHRSAMMTLEELSRSTGVSVATANRLAAKLGLAGYPDLKRLLRSGLQEALQPSPEAIDALQVRGGARGAAWARSLDEDVRRIQGFSATTSDGALASACTQLAKARRLFVAGFGSSAFLAQYAAFNFSTLRPNCESITDSSGVEGLSRRLVDAGHDDIVLQLAFARYSEIGTRMGREFVARDVPVIAITDSATSPVASLAKTSFVIPKKSGFVLTGGGAGAVAVIEALLHGTAGAIGIERVEDRAAEISKIIGPALVRSD